MKYLLPVLILFTVMMCVPAKGHKVFFHKEAEPDTIYLEKKPYMLAEQDGDSYYLTTTEGFIIIEIRKNGTGNTVIVFPVLNKYIYSEHKGDVRAMAKAFLVDNTIYDGNNKETGISDLVLGRLYRHMLLQAGSILSEHKEQTSLAIGIHFTRKYQDTGVIMNDSIPIAYFAVRSHIDYKHNVLYTIRWMKELRDGHTFFFIYNTKGEQIAEMTLYYGNRGDDVTVLTHSGQEFKYRNIATKEQALTIASKLLVMQELIHVKN